MPSRCDEDRAQMTAEELPAMQPPVGGAGTMALKLMDALQCAINEGAGDAERVGAAVAVRKLPGPGMHTLHSGWAAKGGGARR